MPSKRRPLRLGQEIQNILLGVIDSIRDARVGLATVTHVEMTPDLRLAKVYVSVSGAPHEKELALKALGHAKGYIRSELSQQLHVRRIPDLQFYLDDTLEQGNRIDQLLAEIHKKDPSS